MEEFWGLRPDSAFKLLGFLKAGVNLKVSDIYACCRRALADGKASCKTTQGLDSSLQFYVSYNSGLLVFTYFRWFDFVAFYE